jgi:ribosomal protein L6P/L9E
MSRIGKSPICIPPKVKVVVEGSHAIVEGPLGKNAKTFDDSVIRNRWTMKYLCVVGMKMTSILA